MWPPSWSEAAILQCLAPAISLPTNYLYKHLLPERDLLPLALFSSTTLPLVVAVTYLGVRTGDMLPENASALVAAAVITVAVFPALAIVLRAKSEGAQPDGVVAIAVHRIADLASAQFSRFVVFVSQIYSFLLLRRAHKISI